ncbi:hypothetical protein HAX54_033298 [Datura stramonium]|uniref:S-acyltransferase n=1 Tax=Datura stramonium TaxID=4076 RepID=A0ABS8SD61_DATST|nr:hypothetical protein [Datura stramonium]
MPTKEKKVAVAVFLALGFAFYVFALFCGALLQYIVMGLYTPLIISAFGLYIWCAAADPADPGVFKSKKYLKKLDNKKQVQLKESKLGRHEESSQEQLSEDGMFYCSLCEVEVFKYSKHCRVCDKCVDQFDHHCRWINNCIGKRNYRKFFTLMVSALLLLMFQWSTGILAVCTILAMIATLPLAQLFFFHILLIKKGISTYDYIIALRDQEQQGVAGLQSPQMSTVSSLTGLSSASSFNTFHRAAWCTPPRLFVEDQLEIENGVGQRLRGIKANCMGIEMKRSS